MGKDIYFKDEKNYLTVCFQTPKAIYAIGKQPKKVQDKLHGSNEHKEMHVDFTHKSMIIAWAMSENLSWKSDAKIILN